MEYYSVIKKNELLIHITSIHLKLHSTTDPTDINKYEELLMEK